MIKQSKKKSNFLRILIALMLCFFCSFSFFGCTGMGGYGGSTSGSGGTTTPTNPDKDNNSGNSGSSGSGSGSGGSDDSDSDDAGDYGEDEYTISDYNDVFAGAIGVYELDSLEEVFYDQYVSKNVNFEFLVDRQFDAMATFLYNSLNRVYGSDSSSTSIDISGYSTGTRQVSMSGMITDANQAILAGLSTGTLTNSTLLSYGNAINGGYDMEVVKQETTDESGNTYTSITSISYTSNLIDTYSWRGKSNFNKEFLKKVLAYIYLNQQDVLNPDSVISFASDADVSLKNYYNNFVLSDSLINSVDMSSLPSIGMTRKYLWNVAYFMAFSMIGESNILNSINNHNTIFSGSSIAAITADNHTAELEAKYESYKGYHIVVGQIINSMSKLSVDTNGTTKIIYGDTTTNWNTTLYPSVKKEKYIYYDNINDICDAQGIDYSTFEDWENVDQYNTEGGTAYRLKRLILIPYMNTNYKANDFNIQGVMIAFKSTSGEYTVKITYNAVFDTTSDAGDAIIKIYDKDSDGIPTGTYTEGNQITFDSEYDSDIDDLDVEMPLGESSVFKKSSTSLAQNKTLVDASFTTVNKTITYDTWDSRVVNLGMLNVYNQLFSNAELAITSNYMTIDFEYYNGSTLLTTAPEAYLMYFDFY